jgi:hypothetical protein
MTGPGSARACPRCGGQVSASAAFCGACGLLLAPPTPVRRRSAGPRTVFLAVVVAVALVGAGVGAGLLLQPKDGAGGGTAAGASAGPATPGSTTGVPGALATPPIVEGGVDITALVPPDPGEGDVPPVEETTPTTGHLTLGAASALASQTIGASGGTIEASGFRLEFPAGALAADTPVSITAAPVTAADFGGLFTPLTPLYSVSAGDGSLAAAVTVTLPASVPGGAVPLAFYYDDAAGTLTPLAPLGFDATSITAAANHFSGIVGGEFHDKADSPTVDSGFRPGIDDWQFTNIGSYIAPSGHCEGQSDTAIWYYVAQRRKGGASPLYGLYDNNGAPEKTTTFQWDDSQGYRLASNVQVDPTADSLHYWRSVRRLFGRPDDRMTWAAFRAAIAFSGEPQEIAISTGGDPEHAMIVYRVSADRLFIADPNFPARLRTIKYDAASGKLADYSSGANAADIAANGATIFTKFAYVPWRTAASEKQLAAHWAEFQNNAAGDAVFPVPTIQVLAGKDAAGKEVWAPLVDGYRTAEKKLTVKILKLTDGRSSALRFYRGTSTTPIGPLSWKQTIDLEGGANKLGILVLGRVPPAAPEPGKPAPQSTWEFINFLRLTVNSGESTDWELVDVQVRHTSVSVNQDYDWKYEGDGRGGITGVWTTQTSTGTATARMVGTWDIPDRLTPGTQVSVSGTIKSKVGFKSGAAEWCSGGMYQLGPEDGSLDAFAMNEAAAAPDIGRTAVPADQVQRLFSTMIGCDTGAGTMSAEKTATGTLTVPDRLVVTGDQVPYLVVSFVLDHDYDAVQVSYIYR